MPRMGDHLIGGGGSVVVVRGALVVFTFVVLTGAGVVVVAAARLTLGESVVAPSTDTLYTSAVFDNVLEWIANALTI